MDTMLQIGKRLKQLRQEKQATQKEVADVLGVNAAAYSKIERGENGLSFDHCMRLADYYSVSCDFILRGVSSEHIDFFRETGLSENAIQTLKKQKQELTSIEASLEATTESDNSFSMNVHKRHILSLFFLLVNRMLSNESFLDRIAREWMRVCEQDLFAISGSKSERGSDSDVLNEIHLRWDCETVENASRYKASLLLNDFMDELLSDPEWLEVFFKYPPVEISGMSEESIRKIGARLHLF